MQSISDEDVIVGSGPSGVATAHALLARGGKVRMLDVGETLEQIHADRMDRMGAKEPASWLKEDAESLRRLRRENTAQAMLPYGSDFALRDVVGLLASKPSPEVGLRPSFARGGLSNGWGSAVAPYRLEDMSDWPREAVRLESHYKAVARFMPVAALADDLLEVFPMWRPEQSRPLPASPQGAMLLGRLATRRELLGRSGIRFGQARQAVASNCRSCGMCLYGCPYRLIFNASKALDDLMRHERFIYEPHRYVQRFEEDGDHVRLRVQDLDTGAPRTITARRVFLAAGVLPTAQIVLASLAAPDATLTLLDSQHAFMPMLHFWRGPANVEAAPQHVLAQAFLEVLDPAISPESVHVQIYTYNDHFPSDLRARFQHLGALANPMVRGLSRRLVVAQVFLHSNRSGRIRVARHGSGQSQLSLSAEENPQTLPTLRRATQRLAKALLGCGLVALPFMARPGPIGSSFHCGGSLPMRNAPRGMETDILGRPAGLTRVHVVDASVLPSIPASTITFSVMANAHRIASTAPT